MKSPRAFSLAEVLLSLAVLALILVMAVGVLHFSLYSSRRGEHALRASLLAQEKVAWAERAPLAEVTGQGAFPSPWESYTFRLAQEGVEPGLVRVRVTVEGPSGARASLDSRRREEPREVILTVRDGVNWRLARAREEGGARTVLPGTAGSDTQPTVSADGRTVVFASTHLGLGLWSMPTDGSAPPTRLTGVPDGASSPSFAPQGNRLAFLAPDEDGVSQVFVYEGGASQQLTNLDVQASCPGWAPGGSQLVVVLEGSTIATLSADGGSTQVLVEGEGWNSSPAFSPDGQWLAFMTNRDGNPEVYRAKSDGSQLERLTRDPGYDTHPRWSADGRRLLFQSNRNGVQRVWSMNPDGTDQRRLGRPEDEATPPGALPEGEPVFLPAP